MGSRVGDASEMSRAIDMLSEVKEAIVNSYELKTGLSRARIAHLMDAESWMNAKTAIELGFADGMLYSEDAAHGGEPAPIFNSVLFSKRDAANSLLQRLIPKPAGKPVKSLYERLFELNH